MSTPTKHPLSGRFSLKNRISLAFGLALLVLAIVAVASYRNIMQLRADVSWVEHTYQVSRTIRTLFSKLAEAESDQRGFVITGTPEFLKRFSLAEQSLPATLATLRDLTKDNPRQQRRLDTLQQLIVKKLAFAHENIEIRKHKSLEAAVQLVGTGRGYQLMDQISALIAEMQQEESQLMAERDQATDQTIRETTWVIAAGLLLAFLVVPAASFVTSREIGRRAQAEEAIEESEQKYRQLVENIPDVVWTANLTGKAIFVSPSVARVIGFSPEEVYQGGEGMGFDRVHPDDVERVRAAYEALFERGERFEEEYRYLRKDGEWIWLHGRAVGVHEKDGTRYIDGVISDITARKRFEEALRKAYGDLEAVNKELEAFTYSVSHDLRAPLRHVDGFAKLLCEEFAPQLDATAQHYLSRIQAGTRQMAQLVDDLLNLARVGRQEPRRQATGLNSLVSEVVAELKPEAQGRPIEWRIGGLPFADCDPALVKQVFANLISNALKFTRPRAPGIIEVGQLERNGQPVIFVRDNGVGFSMKYADKLFGVFQRLHRAEDFEGTGVGLATVQRIIHKHGGQVWAEAELDKGATFYFTLGSPENTGARSAIHSAKEVSV